MSDAETVETDNLDVVWPLVFFKTKMPLPNIMIQDKFWSPRNMGSRVTFPLSPKENARLDNYADSWWFMIKQHTELAFEKMAIDCKRDEVITRDILRFSAANVYDVDESDGDAVILSNMSGRPSKENWLKLYKCSNPVYRLIAFVHYNKVNQSPDELLKIYEDGLFHSCSYIEKRILVGIYKAKDFRPEVLELVKRYSKSNPVDDGTLGRSFTFRTLGEGIEAVLAGENTKLK